MKFLIDNNLSPLLADALKADGHDAAHVLDLSIQAAPDETVPERARADGQVLICTDTDYIGVRAVLTQLVTEPPSLLVAFVRVVALKRLR